MGSILLLLTISALVRGSQGYLFNRNPPVLIPRPAQGVPSYFNEVAISELCGKVKLSYIDALTMETEDFLTAIINDSTVVRDYLASKNMSAEQISKFMSSTMNVFMSSMPRYSFEQMWKLPLNTFLHYVQFYMSGAGTADVVTYLASIFQVMEADVVAAFDEPRSTLVAKPYIDQVRQKAWFAIQRLELPRMKSYLALLNVTEEKLKFVGEVTVLDLNNLFTNVIHASLHNVDASVHLQIITSIIDKVRLLESSFYQWSVSCRYSTAYYRAERLESISQSCFKKSWQETAKVLFSMSPESSSRLEIYDMTESDLLANSVFMQSDLDKPTVYIGKVEQGLQFVESEARKPLISSTFSGNVSIDNLTRNPLSTTLEEVHRKPWSLLKKIYRLDLYTSTIGAAIAFNNLYLVLKNDQLTTQYLRTLSLESLFDMISHNSTIAQVEFEFRTNVMLISGDSLDVLSRKYEISLTSMMQSTLYQLVEVTFGLSRVDFNKLFTVASYELDFFSKATLDHIRKFTQLSATVIVKKSLSGIRGLFDRNNSRFASAMIESPASLSRRYGHDVLQRTTWSVTQFVSLYDNIPQVDFQNFMAAWSSSTELAAMFREVPLIYLSERIKVHVAEIVNITIIDLAGMLTLAFGSECDPNVRSPYCAALQTCQWTRAGYRCQCDEGYRFLTTNLCVDYDECQVMLSSCSPNADCVNTQGSYQCVCRRGFQGDGFQCVDVDECALSVCDPNAMCTNTIGRYECRCKQGYFGIGSGCADINECARGDYTCSPDAFCKNIPGSYACVCKLGYSGDGKTCRDVDECESPLSACPRFSDCTNSIGSYQCTCRRGFVMVGNECQDRDECLMDKNETNCSAKAVCRNLINGEGYECACSIGYVGNGTFCTDVNECVQPDPCGKGKCENTDGWYRCNCDQGYNFTGTSCTDVNECLAQDIHPICNGSAVCENIEGSYTCVDKAAPVSGRSTATILAISIPIAVGLIVIIVVAVYFIRKMYVDKQGKKELLRFDNTLNTLFRNKAFQSDTDISKYPSGPDVASTKSADRQNAKTQMPREATVHLQIPDPVLSLPRASSRASLHPPSYPSSRPPSRPPSRISFSPPRENGFA